MDRPPPPDGIDLSQDRRAEIVATSVVTWVLAVVAIVLRLVSRRMKGVKLWLDDWLIIATLVPSCLHTFVIAGYAVSRGLGRHVWVTPPDSRRAWALSLFVAELGYFITFTLVKWSILAFYWRSFRVRRSIRIPIWTLATIVLLWGIAVILVTLFQCQPTHAFWSRFDPVNPLPPSEYNCGIEDTKFFYGNAIPTIVTDVLMLLLPIPYIYSLQLRKGQKWALAGIFLVGLFVTLVSIIRLNYLLKGDVEDPDITWNFVDIGLWSVVEANIAMVCACLPFLRPVLNKLTCGIFGTSSSGSSPHKSSNFIKVSNKNASNPWDHAGSSNPASTTVQATGDSDSDESPFMSTGVPERKVSSITDGQSSIEMKDVQPKPTPRPPPLRLNSLGEGIMVTREITMKRQTLRQESDLYLQQ